jgi:hypothetical protein
MNVLKATHVIAMLPVLTMKVLLTVTVILVILETDLIALVSESFIQLFGIFYLSSNDVLFVVLL